MSITQQITVEDMFTSGEQPEVIDENLFITKITSVSETLGEEEEEQVYARADFERDLKSVCRKVKKQ